MYTHAGPAADEASIDGASVAEPCTAVRPTADADGRPGADRTRLLLEGSILPTLLRLAAPNLAVVILVTATSTLDAVFVGALGAEALAGVTLVFPMLMLMVTMANGGMGGGVASAIARGALGAGRRAEADALVAHALAIAAGMALLFTIGALWGGPILYRALAGDAPGVAEAAVAYSNAVFVGALAYWLLYILSSVVRGTGNMLLPARARCPSRPDVPPSPGGHSGVTSARRSGVRSSASAASSRSAAARCMSLLTCE